MWTTADLAGRGTRQAKCDGKASLWTTEASFSGGTDVFQFRSVMYPMVCLNVPGSLEKELFHNKQLLVWDCIIEDRNFDFKFNPKTSTITPPTDGYRDKISGPTAYKWLDKVCEGEHETNCCLSGPGGITFGSVHSWGNQFLILACCGLVLYFGVAMFNNQIRGKTGADVLPLISGKESLLQPLESAATTVLHHVHLPLVTCRDVRMYVSM